jgi:hypothetical protein
MCRSVAHLPAFGGGANCSAIVVGAVPSQTSRTLGDEACLRRGSESWGSASWTFQPWVRKRQNVQGPHRNIGLLQPTGGNLNESRPELSRTVGNESCQEGTPSRGRCPNHCEGWKVNISYADLRHDQGVLLGAPRKGYQGKPILTFQQRPGRWDAVTSARPHCATVSAGSAL